LAARLAQRVADKKEKTMKKKPKPATVTVIEIDKTMSHMTGLAARMRKQMDKYYSQPIGRTNANS